MIHLFLINYFSEVVSLLQILLDGLNSGISLKEKKWLRVGESSLQHGTFLDCKLLISVVIQ